MYKRTFGTASSAFEQRTLIREVAHIYSIGLFNWFAGASGG